MNDFRLCDPHSPPPSEEWEPSAWPEADLRDWAGDPFRTHDLFAAYHEHGLRPSWLGHDGAIEVTLAAIRSGRLRLYRRRPLCGLVSAAPATPGQPAPELPWNQDPPPDPVPDPEETDEADWIEIEVVLESGEPVRDEPITITLPDGSTRAATTDENGVARLLQIASGVCELRFSRDRRELRAG